MSIYSSKIVAGRYLKEVFSRISGSPFDYLFLVLPLSDHAGNLWEFHLEEFLIIFPLEKLGLLGTDSGTNVLVIARVWPDSERKPGGAVGR